MGATPWGKQDGGRFPRFSIETIDRDMCAMMMITHDVTPVVDAYGSTGLAFCADGSRDQD